MKLGIDAYCSCGYDLPMEERFRLIKSAGFSVTSLYWSNEHRHKWPEQARKIGLEIDHFHADIGEPNTIWQEGIDGENYMKMLTDCVEDCKTHDVDILAIHLSNSQSPPPNELGLNRIAKLVDFAEQKNVKLAFENLWKFEHLDAVFARFNSPNVGFCYDIGHENLSQNLHYNCLDLHGDRLFCLHIQDNDGGEHDLHLLPFDGNINWREKMQKLKQCKPVDCLMLETCFNWIGPQDHEMRDIYRDLTIEQYLALACERAQKLLTL